MDTETQRKGSSVATRRFGYALAAAINAAIIYAIHVWPGWQAVPFLTEDTTKVLGLVTISLAAGLVANLLYLVADPPAVRALGELVTTGIGVAVLVRLWQVFPFDFSAYDFPWRGTVRIILIVGIVGSLIGMLIRLVRLLRSGT